MKTDTNTETSTPEIEILTYLNELAGKRFKPIKSNLKTISVKSANNSI